jgi:hypothetical protein
MEEILISKSRYVYLNKLEEFFNFVKEEENFNELKFLNEETLKKIWDNKEDDKAFENL